jgi:hypothetical protein
MTEQSMPKDERADALLALKKLLENSPDADPYRIKEAWLEIVWKDELLREAVFGEVFDDLWKQGARTLEEMRELLRKLTSTTEGREPNTAPENRYETTDELFQLVKPIMDKAQMSDQGKAFVLNSLRTSEQVPEITSEEQYELYSKLERELSAQLPERDDPTYGKAFLTFTRSPAGVLANAYAARMIEWENKERGEHWVP